MEERQRFVMILQMKRLMQEEFEKHGFHPAKSFVVGFIQIPLWISMSLALRNMCGWINVKGLGKLNRPFCFVHLFLNIFELVVFVDLDSHH